MQHHHQFLLICGFAFALMPMIAALTVAFTPTPLAAGEKIIIQATGQLSAGRSFAPRSAYKNVFVGAAASASPSNILAAYNAIFGPLVAGMKIFYRVYSISSTGIASTPLLSSKVVT